MEKNNWARVVLLVFFCMHVCIGQVFATEVMEVGVNQSRVLAFAGVEKVAVANPEIADVLVVSKSELLVVGKRLGSTSLHIWSSKGRSSYTIKVSADDTVIAQVIKEALGYSSVRVQKIGQTVVLEGAVTDQIQKNRAEKLAAMYGDKVVNLIEVHKPLQIKIEAVILEIDRQKSKDLGIKWGNGLGSGFSAGIFSLGQGYGNPVGGGNPFGQLGGYDAVNTQLSALVKSEVAHILSQPNLVTLSGEKANIMVGGQIPVPVSVQGNQIGIEWKDYGIKLDIIPEADSSGLITSKVKAEVSSLDWNSTHKIQIGSNMYIPPMKMRKAETVIALTMGQTMAIGGLISNEMIEDVQKVPLLSDIPILGNLFKSKSFNKNETELIILITPSIVDVDAEQKNIQTDITKFKNANP